MASPDYRSEPDCPRWLDQDERATWLSLSRIIVKLPSALDAQLERDADLNYFEYIVMAMLSEQDDRTLRMSQLAALSNASLSRLSHVAKRLESRGFLQREPDPDDGRYTRAVLTDAGLAKVVGSAGGHVNAVRQPGVRRPQPGPAAPAAGVDRRDPRAGGPGQQRLAAAAGDLSGPMSAADPVRLSVVVPAYNEAATLPATLASLQRQDYRGGYEVIVVDNASTDGTADVATRWGARVLHEAQPGVCAARQTGTAAARGDVVVSTDADTVHPSGWLTRLDAQLADDVFAVAGPCRYVDAPWWARVVPPLWFAAIALVHRLTGRVLYLTATNVAFRRDGFPGYDTTLTQGGDEVDLLRRLRRCGRVVWDAQNPVLTSSRRMDQGLLHTLVVSYGYHYALDLALSRLAPGRRMGVAPAIRAEHAGVSRRRRRQWRAGLVVAAMALLLTRRGRRTPR